MNKHPKIIELKKQIIMAIKEITLEESKRLFADHPEITSFGWHQFIEVESIHRYLRFEDSLERPDVSGNQGEYIYSNSELYPVQKKVAEFLKTLDNDILIAAFGDGVDIAIYPDQTIEVVAENEYDYDLIEL